MEKISFMGYDYPAFQATGNAARFAIPFAQAIIGEDKLVADVGCNRAEWAHPNSVMIDLDFDDKYHAMNLPDLKFDAIFSSHFLEHYIGRFQEVIEYWISILPKGGIIFLYLPHMGAQAYWAFENKKHIHQLTPDVMDGYCQYLKCKGLISDAIITKSPDLNSSFYCVIEKA